MHSIKKILAIVLSVVLFFAVASCGTSSNNGASSEGASSASSSTEGATSTNSTSEAASSTNALADDSSGGSGDKITVRYALMAFANEVAGWTAMIEEANKIFEEEGKNIEIVIDNYYGQDWPDYHQKITTQLAGGDSLDIGRIAERMVPTAISLGQLTDLTDYLENDFDMSLYYEGTFDNAAHLDDRFYGIPSGAYNLIMYYNKDLFDEAGLPYPSSDWNNPISFEDFRSTAMALTSGSGAEKVFGGRIPMGMQNIGNFANTFGGDLCFDADGNPSMNNDYTKRVASWFNDMIHVDYSVPRPTDTALMQAMDMFLSGRIAMLVDGTWRLGQIALIEDMNVGCAALPAGGGKAQTLAYLDSFVIWSSTKIEEACWEALKAMNSERAIEKLAVTGIGGVPIARSVSTQYVDISLGHVLDEDSKNCIVDALDFVVPVPYSIFWEQAEQRSAAPSDEWMNGNITYLEMLEQFQQILIDFKQQYTGS